MKNDFGTICSKFCEKVHCFLDKIIYNIENNKQFIFKSV